MTNYVAVIAIGSLAGALILGFIASAVAATFFERVVRAHPELSDAFPLPGFNTRYGPIRPSYMKYLKAKKHLQLSDPGLRAAGTNLLHLLYAHAVLFTVFVLSALWWGYQNGA